MTTNIQCASSRARASYAFVGDIIPYLLLYCMQLMSAAAAAAVMQLLRAAATTCIAAFESCCYCRVAHGNTCSCSVKYRTSRQSQQANKARARHTVDEGHYTCVTLVKNFESRSLYLVIESISSRFFAGSSTLYLNHADVAVLAYPYDISQTAVGHALSRRTKSMVSDQNSKTSTLNYPIPG